MLHVLSRLSRSCSSLAPLALALALSACDSSTSSPAQDLSSPPVPGVDMTTPAAPDLATTAALKAVGDPCANKSECGGPNPLCVDTISLPQPNGTAVDLRMPESACLNSACDIADSTNTCGKGGVCIEMGSGPMCLQGCSRGTCRSGYKCLYRPVSKDPSKTAQASVCIPSELLVLECDPTADPKSQCTKYQGQTVADLTNGDPNAACVRRGEDNVGVCDFLPCQVGPNNCVGNATCIFINLATQYPGGKPEDRYAGTLCYPFASPIKKNGEACTFLNQCEDNNICYNGTCAQMCYVGTQPSFAGGSASHKNAATACAAGSTCKNVFNQAGANYPGACVKN